MKKLLFVFTLMLGAMFASCGGSNTTKESEPVDSVKVDTVDTVTVDTLVSDSVLSL